MRCIVHLVIGTVLGIACFFIPGLLAYFLAMGIYDEEDDGLERHRHHERTIDEAAVTFVTSVDIAVFSQSTACDGCPLVKDLSLHAHKNKTLYFNTDFAWHLKVQELDGNGVLCESQHAMLVDQGQYLINVSDIKKADDCPFRLLNSPPDPNLPVYVAIAAIVGACLLWILLKHLYRRGLFNRFMWCFQTDQLINTDLGTPLISDDGFSGSLAQSSSRICAIDTFRGLSLMIMVFVNYGGGEYWYFRHSAWNGLTVADLVFPWFVFLMGTSIAVSFRSACRRGTSRLTMVLRIFKRTVILFLLGLALSNHGKDVMATKLRVFGVLQRLAVTYFAVAMCDVFVAVPSDPHAHKWWRGFRELVVSWPAWVLATAMLVLHLCLTFELEVPGCEKGYLGPGGLHDERKYENCTGGAAGYIDRLVLTPDHMYGHPTCKRVYECSQPFDPEGILGTLMSILLCIFGLQAGKILITYQTPRGLLGRWLSWGLATGILAVVLCTWRQDGGWIPINKNLWSLSYVLAMAGTAFVLVAVFYFVIDARGYWSGAPFIYPGMNSILIYVCHEVFEDYFPLQFQVAQTHASQLALDIWATVFWIVVAAVLHYKKVFVAI